MTGISLRGQSVGGAACGPGGGRRFLCRHILEMHAVSIAPRLHRCAELGDQYADCRKNCLDWHCATPIQSAVAAFISEGHLARHVGKMREIYRTRRQLLLNTLRETLSEWPGAHSIALRHAYLRHSARRR